MSTKIEQLSFSRHKDLKFTAMECYPLADNIAINPIYNSEIIQLSRYFPIIFPGPTPSTVRLPVTLFALAAKQKNRFVDADGSWIYDYVPSRIRCYPFGLKKVNSNGHETILIDVDAPHFTKSDGVSLFNDDGTPGKLLEEKINFFKRLKHEERLTELFVKKLDEAGLLVQKKISSSRHDDSENCFSGFYVVDPNRFAKLDNKQFLDLRQHNFLPLIYGHLASLDRFDNLIAPSPPAPLNTKTDNVVENIEKPKSKKPFIGVASHIAAAFFGAVLVMLVTMFSPINKISTNSSPINYVDTKTITAPDRDGGKKVETKPIAIPTNHPLQAEILSSKKADKTNKAIAKKKEEDKAPNQDNGPQLLLLTTKSLPTSVARLNLENIIENSNIVTAEETPTISKKDSIDNSLPTKESNIKTVKPYTLSDSSSLLKAAEEDIIANRLTRPVDNNAAQKILFILKKNPDNPQAKILLAKLISRYEKL
ncbi:MAG: SapC family protein, partial [Magnetococcales bacterium]|nr:SapC family protein [Magnetococcales bacterium]